MIVDSAIYREGSRIEAPETLAALNAACRGGAGIAWIGLYRPSEQEFSDIAREFGLDALAVEDAVQAHQRPKARALRRHAVPRAAFRAVPR